VVILDRKLSGIVPYRMIFFPTADVVRQVTRKLAANCMARLFAADEGMGSNGSRVVWHNIGTTTCIDLQQSSDAILRNMAQTTRNRARQGERLGGHVQVERNGARAESDFLKLYEQLAAAKSGHLSRLDAAVLERYAACRDVFVIYLDGEVICGHVNLRDEGHPRRARALYSASRRFEDHKVAQLCGVLNCYLHWREIQAYQSENFKIYDFGGISRGTSPGAEGIDRFKLSFGGKTVQEHNYVCAGIPTLGRLAMRFFGTGQSR
jgi:hypothetical protein